MDLGVGSFVFSMGLISALPYLRSPSLRLKPIIPQLLNSIRKSLPVFALGMVRVWMVKGIEYPVSDLPLALIIFRRVTDKRLLFRNMYLSTVCTGISSSLLGYCRSSAHC